MSARAAWSTISPSGLTMLAQAARERRLPARSSRPGNAGANRAFPVDDRSTASGRVAQRLGFLCRPRAVPMPIHLSRSLLPCPCPCPCTAGLRAGVARGGTYRYFGAGSGVMLLALALVLLDPQLPRANALVASAAVFLAAGPSAGMPSPPWPPDCSPAARPARPSLAGSPATPCGAPLPPSASSSPSNSGYIRTDDPLEGRDPRPEANPLSSLENRTPTASRPPCNRLISDEVQVGLSQKSVPLGPLGGVSLSQSSRRVPAVRGFYQSLRYR